MTETLSNTEVRQVVENDVPWVVLLWDDPVNTTEYVSHVLRKVFSIGPDKAHQLMMKAHVDGKAAVWSGEKAVAEQHCAALHGWSLNASLTKADA